MLFSYRLGDKKTDEKAKNLLPENRKMIDIKFHSMEKNVCFAIFIHLLLLYEIV